MSNNSQQMNLCIVVDPDYGEFLEEVASRLPVWIVDTPVNRPIFERIWSRRSVGEAINISAPGSITSCKIADYNDRELSLLEIIPDIEVHYGAGDRAYEPLRIDPNHRYAHLPNGFGVDVIGIALSDFIRSRLSDFGFGEFLPTSAGFQTWIFRKHTVPPQ